MISWILTYGEGVLAADLTRLQSLAVQNQGNAFQIVRDLTSWGDLDAWAMFLSQIFFMFTVFDAFSIVSEAAPAAEWSTAWKSLHGGCASS